MMAKDDRLRVAVDDAYVAALGRATFVFAILEWNAVWCAEHLSPGFLNGIAKKTAGKIAVDFLALVEKITDPALKAGCKPPAIEFKRLVNIRNGILHGKPGTAPDGAQRLFRDGTAWSPEAIDSAADEFAACGIQLNALLHNQLR